MSGQDWVTLSLSLPRSGTWDKAFRLEASLSPSVERAQLTCNDCKTRLQVFDAPPIKRWGLGPRSLSLGRFLIGPINKV